MVDKIIILVSVALSAGCSQMKSESDNWQRGEESTRRQEWRYTNGMAWPLAATNEVVMSLGTRITAQTSDGEVSILAGPGFERFYNWNGETRSAKLWPRKQRWWGRFGIYYPGPGEHWKANHGLTRGVLEEATLWFKTIDDFLAWIKRARSTGIDYVYTNEGLVIGFGKFSARKQVNIDVWQVMIDGRKPVSLPGSRNDLVSVKP